MKHSQVKHETLRNSHSQKMDLNNSQMETWNSQKCLNLREKHEVCRSGEKKAKTTNQHFEWFHETGCTYVFAHGLMLCVAQDKTNLCHHNKGYTFSNVCCLFLPNVRLCVVRARKARGIKWKVDTDILFQKDQDQLHDASCSVFFSETCAVYGTQMEFNILKMLLMACAGFWMRKAYDILPSGTLWHLLKHLEIS